MKTPYLYALLCITYYAAFLTFEFSNKKDKDRKMIEMRIRFRSLLHAAVALILTVLILSEGSRATKFTARNLRHHSGLWILCSGRDPLCLPYRKCAELHPEPGDMVPPSCAGVYKRSCEQINWKAEPEWKYFTVFELFIDEWRCSTGCEFEGREDGWYWWNPETRIWDRLRPVPSI